jgi:hypothetical protein
VPEPSGNGRNARRFITRTLRRSAIRWRCLQGIPVNSLAALYPIRSFLISLGRQDLSILTQNGFSVRRHSPAEIAINQIIIRREL